MKKLHIETKEKFNNYLMGIDGEKIIVEIDESKFWKRKNNKGHEVDGVWVLGLVERTKNKKILFIPVQNRSKNTLTPIILRYVKKGSIIYTDKWKGYRDLSKYYIHLTVDHSKKLKIPILVFTLI